MLVQYSGNAQEMLQALNDAGFLENGIIRNWAERNSFHVTNHDRAKKAAEARWAKRTEKLSEEKDRDKDKEKEKESKQASLKQCLGNATSIRFVPPTREQLNLEAEKLGLPSIEVDKFVAYYASNGWRVGKVPMKSWPHALAGWATRWKERSQSLSLGDNRYQTATADDAAF